jgi:hypothetical protein
MWGLPGEVYLCRSSTRYTADGGGFITNVANNDVPDLLDAACSPMAVSGLIGRLINANMNVTTDQPIPLNVPTGARYLLTKIWLGNASTSLTTAAGGIYTAAAKGGTVIVLAATVYTGFTGPTVYATIAGGVVAAQLALAQTANPLYFNLTTAQGAAATADIFVYGDLIG